MKINLTKVVVLVLWAIGQAACQSDSPMVVINVPNTVIFPAGTTSIPLTGTASSSRSNQTSVQLVSYQNVSAANVIASGKATGTSNWSASIQVVSTAPNVITVSAKDSSGAIGSASITVTVLTASPSPSPTPPPTPDPTPTDFNSELNSHFNVPVMVVVLPLKVAAVSTGKF